MKNLFSVMLINLFLLTSIGISQTDCNIKNVRSSFTDAEAKLNSTILQLEKLLNGEKVDSSVLSEVFDHQYDVLDDNAIEKLKIDQKRNLGVAPEHLYLVNCLEELKRIENKETLISLSEKINTLKLDVYKKNKKLNNALKSSIDNSNAIPSLKDQLTKSNDISENEKILLEKSLADDEVKIESTNDLLQKEYIQYIKTFKKIKIELLQKQIEYNSSLEKKIKYIEDKIPAEYTDFNKVEALWLEISKENATHLLDTEISFEFPTIPEMPIRFKELGKDQASEIAILRQSIVELKQASIISLTDKKESELKILNDLLVQVNSLRSSLFADSDFAYKIARIFSLQGIKHIAEEVKLSPYRLLSYAYSSYFKFREMLYRGKSGYAEIAFIVFRLILLILILFGLNRGFIKLEGIITKTLRNHAIRKRDSKLFSSVSSAWNKVKDNSQEIFWIISIFIIQQNHLFHEYSFFIRFFEIIILARLVKAALTLFLSSVSAVNSSSYMAFRKRADFTSNKFKNIFLFYLLMNLFTGAAIGKVYIFTLIKVIIFVYSFIQVLSLAKMWEAEFKRFLETRFAGFVVDGFTKFLSFVPSKLEPILLFIAIIILSIFNFIIDLTENFNFSKKISANLFKKQIESIEASEGSEKSIPGEYREEFAMYSLSKEELYVVQDEKTEKELKQDIMFWHLGKSDEHSLVLYGDKGIGKTSLLKHLCRGLEEETGEEVNFIYTKMPAKTLTKQALKDFISKTLGLEDETNFDLPAADKKFDKKQVIVIDEAQNVFLSQTNGFEAYYYLTDVLNLPTDNIFWVLSFNKSSWNYLDCAFGKTQYFRNVFELKGWSDDKIKELIMKRHEKSTIKLSYDLLINATKSQDEIDRYASIESKFFKLLWELSRGNPRAALALWLTALSRKNSTTFNVNIPKEVELIDLAMASDDQLFVIAHILKHENLSTSEVVSTSNLPRGVVRNALKLSLEKKYLYRDDRSRFMIDITTQHTLIKQLRAKNFIYGN
jgi:GTPase SAR1 family protein